MAKKTRKNLNKNKNNRNSLANQNKDAQKGTLLKCRLKTCKAKKYQDVYGVTYGGNIRTTIPLYF